MRIIDARRTVLVVTVFGTFMSGCVTPPVYGESWARQIEVEGGGCPVIDGAYQNIGEEFVKAKDGSRVRIAHSLAHLLDNWGYDEASRVTEYRLGATLIDPADDPYRSIRLRLIDGRLQVEGALADGSTRTFDVPTRQKCRDSALLLEGHNSADEIEYYRENLALGRAEDGSLLVHWSSTSVFFIFGPNWAERQAVWMRFPPVTLAPAQLQGLTR